MWSVGCILGELSDGQPLFPGESEIDQVCGPNNYTFTHTHTQTYFNLPFFILKESYFILNNICLMSLCAYVLRGITLCSALHHSEGFGTSSCRANEALLQQPSLSWHQSKCLLLLHATPSYCFSSFLFFPSVDLTPFMLFSLLLSVSFTPSLSLSWQT